MNFAIVRYLIGWLMGIESLFLLLPAFTAVIYREPELPAYIATALICMVGAGILCEYKPKNTKFYAREGFVAVALCWLVLAVTGALPFVLSREIPFAVDAIFEAASGFTTTGATILGDVEALSHASMLWRCLMHWVGGMGILVFMMAILRLEGGQGIHLLRAESPGPAVAKMVPRMADSSKILYTIYLALTVIQILFYLAGGMPVFDALCNTFGTAGTGGLAIKRDSFLSYSYYAQTVTTVFMALFGVNFSIYFFLLRRKFDLVWKNTELRWYLGLIFGAIAVITVNTLSYYPRVYDAFHHAAFAVSSIITTTGYGTVDFNLWPELSRVILVFLMIIGACAGSTGGGLKVSRLIILFRAARAEIHRLLHPHTVKVMQMDGKPISRESIRSVSTYLILYVFLVMASVLLVSLDNFDGSTTLTAVLATFNNIGPGLGLVGPTGSFAAFSPLSKIVLCLDMLFGRLELYPMLVLFCPSTWKRK